jgi:hypothetical protein
MRVLGILLVIAGVILLVYGGLMLFIPSGEWWLGSMSITLHEGLAIPLPPILGVFCLLVGFIMTMSVPAARPY